ncbi:MAG: hypothetical protein K8J08_11160 [Thermoanaerobaculia bacterium]|nr:hypothetical protein [Thermoanaerobaculia bacterium]
MVELTSLWLPILLSSVFVFFASSILHMVLPFHRADYDQLDGEDAILDALRDQDAGAGNYLLPHCVTPEQRKSKEIQAKLERGPMVFMTVIPQVAMGKNLIQWFVQSLVLGTLVAYLAAHTLAAGAEYLEVFRIVGTAALLAYAGSEASNSIWMGRKWGTTARHIFDGAVFAALTAGTFGWLWP